MHRPGDGSDTRPLARKSLGQNFLVRRETIKAIVRITDIRPGETVIELGPGLGAITGELAARAARVTAVEIDSRLVSWLTKPGRLPKNVEVLHQDMLYVSFSELAARFGPGLTVVGNLPYNIASRMVFRIVERRAWISRAILMFQKEVAERILGRPGTKDYGILSVMAQAFSDIDRLFDIPPGSFRPVPKVTSTLLRFRFREPATPVLDLDVFKKVVKAAFSRRRKMLANNLKTLSGIDPEVLDEVLGSCGISGRSRAEELDVHSFICLANTLALRCLRQK